MAKRMEWTDERKAELQRLLAAGLTYRQAAKEMGIRHGQAKGAARFYGMTPATPRAPWREWPRSDYDKLGRLLESGVGYDAIAKEMGITPRQAKSTAQRLGMMKRERIGRHRRRGDWPEIDRITRDCIEAKLMTVPQAHHYLRGLGYTMALSSLYRRVRKDAELKRQADSNARRRKVAVGHRLMTAVNLQRKRQHQEAA